MKTLYYMEKQYQAQGSLFFFFGPHQTACGTLVPWPGMGLESPALEPCSLNCWTIKEVPTQVSHPGKICIPKDEISVWVIRNQMWLESEQSEL